LHLRGTHRGAVTLQVGTRHAEVGLVEVEVGAADEALAEHALETLEVGLGLCQGRLVARDVALRGIERGLQRARIDLGEQVALPDVVAWREGQAFDLAVHPRTHVDRGIGFGPANDFQREVDLAPGGHRGRHGHTGLRLGGGPRRLIGVSDVPPYERRQGGGGQEADHDEHVLPWGSLHGVSGRCHLHRSPRGDTRVKVWGRIS
jgi:hypothetical protein